MRLELLLTYRHSAFVSGSRSKPAYEPCVEPVRRARAESPQKGPDRIGGAERTDSNFMRV